MEHLIVQNSIALAQGHRVGLWFDPGHSEVLLLASIAFRKLSHRKCCNQHSQRPSEKQTFNDVWPSLECPALGGFEDVGRSCSAHQIPNGPSPVLQYST